VFSPNLHVDPVRLEGGTVCYIVDDALADPATGRLTLNFFLSSRRNLVARNPDR
jgi:hypothetical protein